MPQPRLLKWILPIGIAATSLILWKDLIDAAQSIRFLYLTIFGAGIIIYLWATGKNKFRTVLPQILNWRNPLFVSIIIWLAATVISLAVALQKSEGLVETARVVFFLLTFIWASICIRINPKNIFYISIGFCLISMILSMIGLKDFFTALPNITTDNSYYEMGNMGNRNLLAIMISLCLPFHFIVLEHYKQVMIRIGLSLNFLAGIAVVGLTGSRVGWLGLVLLFFIGAAIFLAGIIKGSIEKKQIAKFLPALIAVLITLAAPVFFLFLKYPAVAEVTIQRVKSFYDFRSEKNVHSESINERLFIWNNSLQLIRDHPVRGVGAGNWKFHYAEKGLPDRSQKGSVVFLQPHNDFLWVVSETGIIGGLAFVSLFIIGLGYGIKSFYRGQHGAIPLTLLTGVALYAVHSFFDFPKERPLILFTFAFLLALVNIDSNKKITQSSSAKSASIILAVFLAISCFTAWLWIIRIQGELNLKKAIQARQSGNFNGVKTYLDKINPVFFESDLTGAPIAWYKSELAYYRKDRASFKKYSEISIKLNPYQLYNLYNLGSIYYKEGDTKTAIYYWEKVVKIAPRFTDAAVNLSAAYYNQKKHAEAAELLATPAINYQNKSYSAIVATVLGKYISMISDTISDPGLKESLRNLSLNSERVKQLQTLMVRKNKSARDAAISEAIYIASEVEQSISKEDAKQLKLSYGLNEFR